MTSQDLIRIFQLQPHPEGGDYKETYRSTGTIRVKDNKRNISTAIYYLLQDQDRSMFHRIQSDELWFFHVGVALQIILIKDNKAESIIMGSNIENGEVMQAVIPAHTWFAACIKDKKGYALVSCTVAPGFDFADFEIAKRDELLGEYPHLRDQIEEFTKP